MTIRFKLIHPAAVLPMRASTHAAGMDVRAVEPVTIPPGGRRLVRTGLVSEFPEGFELQVRSRSGLALNHGVFVLNSPGTIDADYRGEIRIVLQNSGEVPFVVEIGDRVAQLVPAKVELADVESVSEVGDSGRGVGGFGSTGCK